MAKMPKKPKLKKYPKKPKKSASAQTWINYEERKKATDKENLAKVAEWKKKCAAKNSAETKKKRIVEGVAGIGRVTKVKW